MRVTPNVRRITNRETVESGHGVLELELITVNPRMGATDDARDDPPSLLSDFRLVVASSGVLEKGRHKPATAEHFHIVPTTVTVCSILSSREAVPVGNRT